MDTIYIHPISLVYLYVLGNDRKRAKGSCAKTISILNNLLKMLFFTVCYNHNACHITLSVHLKNSNPAGNINVTLIYNTALFTTTVRRVFSFTCHNKSIIDIILNTQLIIIIMVT